MKTILPLQRAPFRIVCSLLCGLVISACAKSSFSGGKNVPATPPKPDATAPAKGIPVGGPQSQDGKQGAVVPNPVFGLSCDAEISGAPLAVTLVASAADHQIDLSPTCSSVRTGTKTQAVKQPVDIVFVLDLTGSMQSNIDTVKTNVLKFSQKLEERGWDARFAAIGYRDNGESVPAPIAFGGASQLGAAISAGNWVADGGNNAQEAGQDGIASAVSLFLASGRPSVNKVILQVSDETSYVVGGNDSSSDYSVGALATKLKYAGVGKLKFFSSVGETTKAFRAPTPTKQADDVRAQAGIEGGNLSFPLTDAVLLDQFVSQFEVVNSSEVTSCRLLGASFEGSNSVLAASATRLSLGKSEQVAVSAGKLLHVSRCCSVAAGSPGAALESGTCASPVQRTIAIRVEPAR